MSVQGWVYIISNVAMPELLKVGYTIKGSSHRARQLNGAGSPHRFQVLYEALVKDPRAVEQAAHKMLILKHEGKEWFRCSKQEAIVAIGACAKNVLNEHFYFDYSKERPPFKEQAFPRGWCDHYSCGRLGTLPYKGKHYCDDHYEMLRKQRFDWVRSLRSR